MVSVEELKVLINGLVSDSKTESKEAKEKIIEICTPIVKRFFFVKNLFNLEDAMIPFDGCYNPDYGSFDNVGFSGDKLILFYSYGCYGDIYEDELCIDVSWITDTENELRNYFESCRDFKLERLVDEMNKCEKKIELNKKNYNFYSGLVFEKHIK